MNLEIIYFAGSEIKCMMNGT